MHVYCVCPELTKDDDLRPLCCDLVLLIIFVFSLSTPSCLLEKLLQVIVTLFTLSRFSLIHPTFRFVPIAGMHIVMQQLGCITPPPFPQPTAGLFSRGYGVVRRFVLHTTQLPNPSRTRQVSTQRDL